MNRKRRKMNAGSLLAFSPSAFSIQPRTPAHRTMLPTFGVRLLCWVSTLSDTPGCVSKVTGNLLRLTVRTDHPGKPMREEWIPAGMGCFCQDGDERSSGPLRNGRRRVNRLHF